MLELTILAGLLFVLIGMVIAPQYRQYALSRASKDAATTLSADLAYLERAGQNSNAEEGSTLVVESTNPFSYRGYLGRPRSLDPSTKLEQVLLHRTFPGVRLSEGPIGIQTPLLFANNGSAQYETGGNIASQHQTIGFTLTSDTGGNSSLVQLNLFTGAVTVGSSAPG